MWQTDKQQMKVVAMNDEASRLHLRATKLEMPILNAEYAKWTLHTCLIKPFWQ